MRSHTTLRDTAARRNRHVVRSSMFVLLCVPLTHQSAVRGETRDPAAWGDDHVGKDLPEYVTGDECLFCHRKIGPTWGANRHQLTIRPIREDHTGLELLRTANQPEIADAVQFEMGSRFTTRFLRKSKSYGKLELLSATFKLSDTANLCDSKGTIEKPGNAHWDKTTFANRCAGCHTTAVEVKSRSFSALSLDCYTCHGSVDLEHSKQPEIVLLSKQRRDPRRVASICGQCHLRGGKSRSTGLPYPNTFVAGDNLFRDFVVDLREEVVRSRPRAERHIFASTLAVTVKGDRNANCLACHEVHAQSTVKHMDLPHAAICWTCHNDANEMSRLHDGIRRAQRKPTHNRTCDY